MSKRVQIDFRSQLLQVNQAFISTLMQELNASAAFDSCGHVEVFRSPINTAAERDVYAKAQAQLFGDSSALRDQLGTSTAGQLDVNTLLPGWEKVELYDGQGGVQVGEGSDIDIQSHFTVPGHEGAQIVVFEHVDEAGNSSYEIGLSEAFIEDEELYDKYNKAFEKAKAAALRQAQAVSVQGEEEAEISAAMKALQRRMMKAGFTESSDAQALPTGGKARTFAREKQVAEKPKTMAVGGSNE